MASARVVREVLLEAEPRTSAAVV